MLIFVDYVIGVPIVSTIIMPSAKKMSHEWVAHSFRSSRWCLMFTSLLFACEDTSIFAASHKIQRQRPSTTNIHRTCILYTHMRKTYKVLRCRPISQWAWSDRPIWYSISVISLASRHEWCVVCMRVVYATNVAEMQPIALHRTEPDRPVAPAYDSNRLAISCICILSDCTLVVRSRRCESQPNLFCVRVRKSLESVHRENCGSSSRFVFWWCDFDFEVLNNIFFYSRSLPTSVNIDRFSGKIPATLYITIFICIRYWYVA